MRRWKLEGKMFMDALTADKANLKDTIGSEQILNIFAKVDRKRSGSFIALG
jgi:hypothetical protein